MSQQRQADLGYCFRFAGTRGTADGSAGLSIEGVLLRVCYAGNRKFICKNVAKKNENNWYLFLQISAAQAELDQCLKVSSQPLLWCSGPFLNWMAHINKCDISVLFWAQIFEHKYLINTIRHIFSLGRLLGTSHFITMQDVEDAEKRLEVRTVFISYCITLLTNIRPTLTCFLLRRRMLSWPNLRNRAKPNRKN